MVLKFSLINYMINFRFMQKKNFVIFHPHDRNRQLSRIGNLRNSTHFVMSLHNYSKLLECIILTIQLHSIYVNILKVTIPNVIENILQTALILRFQTSCEFHFTHGAVAKSVEGATPGEEVPGWIPAVATRSLLVGSVSV